MECERCGEYTEFEQDTCFECQNEQEVMHEKYIHNENYKNDASRFKWRFHDCADGFVFYLDGKEYINLNELKEDINKKLEYRKDAHV